MASPLVAAILFPLLKLFLSMVTPVLRAELEEFILGYYKRSKESSNKADDIFAALLAALVQVDVSKVVYTPNPGGGLPPEVVNEFINSVVSIGTGKSPFDPPGNQLGGA